jgi:hypothetical protein
MTECPLKGGRFDICTGKALSAPVSDDLKTHPVALRDGRIWVQIGGLAHPARQEPALFGICAKARLHAWLPQGQAPVFAPPRNEASQGPVPEVHCRKRHSAYKKRSSRLTREGLPALPAPPAA